MISECFVYRVTEVIGRGREAHADSERQVDGVGCPDGGFEASRLCHFHGEEGASEVQGGVERGSSELVEQDFDERKREGIFQRLGVELAVVQDETEFCGPSSFSLSWNQEGWGTPR